MVEHISDCFPEIYMSDPPNVSEDAWGQSDVSPWNGQYQAWYPTPEWPGVTLTSTAADRAKLSDAAYHDTIDLVYLQQQGLGPLLAALGIDVHVYRPEGAGPAATAIVHPTTEQFCDRFNTLVAAESRNGPRARLQPYTGKKPVYSYRTLRRRLNEGVYLVASASPQALHDQGHAVALWGLMDGLPRGLKGLPASQAEAIISLGMLVDIMAFPSDSDHMSLAQSRWQQMLRGSGQTVEYAFRRIQERVSTTSERLANLAIAA